MASRHLNLESHFKAISELHDYKIEEGDPDPRGWSVVSSDGTRVGTVEDLVVDLNSMKVRYFVIDVDGRTGTRGSDDRRVLLNADQADLRTDRREVLARGVWDQISSATAYANTRDTAATSTERDRPSITRSEEEVDIRKREVNRGEAVVAKQVETERVSEPVTRRREEAVIERRPVESGARGDAAIKIKDEEIRVPLMEEEVVVEKRPVVKEEVVVGKRIVEERDVIETDVRREKLDIDERADPSSRDKQKPRRSS